MSVAESIAPPATEFVPLLESERLARLRLARSVNVGPRTYAYLLRRFGTAVRALDALPSLVAAGGKGDYVPCPLADAETEIAAGQAAGAAMILLDEAGYPPLLAEIDAPPRCSGRPAGPRFSGAPLSPSSGRATLPRWGCARRATCRGRSARPGR